MGVSCGNWAFTLTILVLATIGCSVASRFPRPALQALMPALARDANELTRDAA